MSLSVTTDVAALTAHRHLARTDGAVQRSLERLSSGHRVIRAADDAAGLAISEGLRSQIGGMTQAVRNTRDGISVIRIADGALGQTTAVLQRLRDLSVQAANEGAVDDLAVRSIQREVDQLRQELTRIVDTTTYNGTRLLDGTYDGTFQIGANAGETISIAIGSIGRGMDVGGLGLSSVDVTGRASLDATVTPAVSGEEGTPAAGRMSVPGDFITPGTVAASYAGLAGTITYDGKAFELDSVDYSGAVTAQDHIDALNVAARAALGTTGYPFAATSGALYFAGDVPGASSSTADADRLTPAYVGRTGASRAIPVIDAAIAQVSGTRADLGAFENRLQHIVDNLAISIQSTTASESRIRDTDMAAEMTVFSRNQVLAQVGTAMSAQANQGRRILLRLLG